MNTRLRVLVLIVSALAALAVVIVSVLRMLAPDLIGELPTSLLARVGGAADLAVALAGALAAIAAIGFIVAADRMSLDAVRAGVLRGAALGAVLALALTTPGGVIPVAGYTFALCVIAGVVAFVLLAVFGRPWLGLALAVVVGGVFVYAALNLGATVLVARILVGFAGFLGQASVAFAHVLAAAGLLVWIIDDARTAAGRMAGFVRRHRIAITVAAAACALPYTLARATWLTPWPMFGGGADLFRAEPLALLTGLLLGFGMLIAGVLTLGLVLPWGERFPRFLAALGGRPVPVGLAVIPATFVSVLFTAVGLEFVFEGVGSAGSRLDLLLVLPFWLWGPLLALAAWGYAMHRADRGDARALGATQPSGRGAHPAV